VAHPLKLLLDELRVLVINLGAMSPSGLRDLRNAVKKKPWPDDFKDLMLQLIDVFLQAGTDPRLRAAAAAGALAALDEIQRTLLGE
jgi:hypothetical protein